MSNLENGNALRNILIKSEMKRVSEKLTKKELCEIYRLNYNYYMNCVSGRNMPSQKMAVKLAKYLQTPTEELYRKVFEVRDNEIEFHENLEIKEDEYNEFLKQLGDDGVLEEPNL